MLDSKAYPVLSYFCRSCVLAVIMTPILYALALFSDLRSAYEIGSETSPIPGSWFELVLGIGETFVFCLLVALILVWFYRIIRGGN